MMYIHFLSEDCWLPIDALGYEAHGYWRAVRGFRNVLFLAAQHGFRLHSDVMRIEMKEVKSCFSNTEAIASHWPAGWT